MEKSLFGGVIPILELNGNHPPQQFGKKTSLEHPRLFGCDAYVHIPKGNKSNLDNKAGKCIFIGYKDSMKVYKLWNLKTKKTIFSRVFFYRG
jgi:hypothetical protein